TGEGWWDSIQLLPTVEQEYVMPDEPLNSENAVWFHFHTDAADGGALPALLARLRSKLFQPFTFTLLNENLQPVSATITTTRLGGNQEVTSQPTLTPGKYFVKVVPRFAAPAGRFFTIELRTSLTYARPTFLECHT